MKRKIKAILTNSVAIILSIVMLLPFYIVFINSFKTQKESAAMGISFPTEWMYENYLTVWKRANILHGFLNSFSYAFVSTVITIIVTLLAAFVLERNKKCKLYNFVYYMLILGVVLPINNIALTKVMSSLHLISTVYGIDLLYAAIGIPLAVFIAYGFMEGIPNELDEASVLDGCRSFQMFTLVICPLCKPLISTLFILNFLNTWNDFTMAIYFLNGAGKMPVSLAIYNFFGQFQQSWNLVCACVVLIALPILLIYIFAQKYIVRGLTSGAVKG